MSELKDCLARENFKKLFDETSALREENVKLRLELHTLHFKDSQQQMFIWWIWNVYSRNVDDLIHAIMGATTYDTEGDAKGGKYALPKQCFDLMKRISEYTEKIYDGTYLDVEISADVKKGIPEKKHDYHNPDYYNRTKTSTDNNKCWWTQESDPEVFPNLWRAGCGNSFYLDAEKPSDNHMKYCCYCGKEIAEGVGKCEPSPSDVSVTRDVLINIKTEGENE